VQTLQKWPQLRQAHELIMAELQSDCISAREACRSAPMTADGSRRWIFIACGIIYLCRTGYDRSK
jgi:hypothetical protein